MNADTLFTGRRGGADACPQRVPISGLWPATAHVLDSARG
jgi:hypothetical protein